MKIYLNKSRMIQKRLDIAQVAILLLIFIVIAGIQVGFLPGYWFKLSIVCGASSTIGIIAFRVFGLPCKTDGSFN